MLSFPAVPGDTAKESVYANVPAEQRDGGAANAATKDYYLSEQLAAALQPGQHRAPGGAQ